MEGTPESAQRLLQVADYSARRNNHHQSALFFEAAASISGISLSVQVRALYNCALQFFEASNKQSQTAVSKLRHALAKLRHASLLVQSQPSFFNLSMHIASLSSRIYVRLNDSRSATLVIDQALSRLTHASSLSSISEEHIHSWWVYFRGRAITFAIASTDDLQKAVEIADATATELCKVQDYLSAAGFFLASVQIRLTISNVDHVEIMSVLKQVDTLLNHVPDLDHNAEVNMDKRLLSFCSCLLEGLAHVRNGHVSPAQLNTLPKLRESYNTLRRLQKQDDTISMWTWFPYKVGSALAFLVMTSVCRGTHRSEEISGYAISALKRVHLKPTNVDNITRDNLNVEGMSKDASILFVSSLLENLVRSYYVSLDLRDAVASLEAIMALAFPDQEAKDIISKADIINQIEFRALLDPSLPFHERVLRSSALLLAAEYYCLRGATDEAERAAIHFQTILENPLISPIINNEGQRSDIWQMAATHLSLLIGEQRISGFPYGIEEDASQVNVIPLPEQFLNQQVLSAAWFAMGIFYMRQSDVVESRRFVERAEQASRNDSTANNQVAACSLAILSCIMMTHENIAPEALKLTGEAMSLSHFIDDPVGMVRTTRQHNRLTARISPEENVNAQAQNVDGILEEKMRGTTSIFSEQCW